MSLIISEVLGGRSVDRTRMTRIGADDHGSLWGKLRVVGFTRVTRATCVVLGRLAQGLKWRLPVLMFGILLAGCGGQAQPTASQPAATQTPFATSPPIVIVAMGDSLTEGFGLNLEDAYPAQLERRLLADGHNVTVINAGNSGETSSGARSRVDWVLNLEPDIVILATGGNDGLRGIEPDVTGENLAQLVERFEEAGVVVVLAGMEMVQNMGEEYTAAFRALYPDVADRYDLLLVPFFLQGVAADPALNQADFIHPTAEGYAVVVETLVPYVVEAIGALAERDDSGR